MAIQTKVHGVDVIAPDQFVGRKLHLLNVAWGGAMTQANLNTLVQTLETVCTLELIGDFTATVSTSVNVIVSGVEDDPLSRLSTLTGKTVTAATF